MEYVLRKTENEKIWKERMDSGFVKELAQGSLPIERFKYLVAQGYLFLVIVAFRVSYYLADKGEDPVCTTESSRRFKDAVLRRRRDGRLKVHFN